jgi:type I restriction enzyme S subunit
MKLETFFEHFDLLAEAPNGVQKLRELILDLAVRGKLVTQDANDEPAAVLLERIKKEKERLVKEGKISKLELLPPIKHNDILYNLPSTWLWVRLGEVVDYNGAAKVSPSEIPEDSWLLELEDIEKDSSKIIQRCTFKERNSKSTKARFLKGDVLYGKLRPYLNKVVIADADGFCTTEIIPLRSYLAGLAHLKPY